MSRKAIRKLWRRNVLRSLDGIAPRIHPTAFVSEAAYVIGDVEIGEGSSVWPGTVIRGDMGRITIGKYTCVQDNSVVHCDTDAAIGDYVVIGHPRRLPRQERRDALATGQRLRGQRRCMDRGRVRGGIRSGGAGRHAGARPLYSSWRAGACARRGSVPTPGAWRVFQQCLQAEDATLPQERRSGFLTVTSCRARPCP